MFSTELGFLALTLTKRFFLFFFSPYLHKGKIPLMVEKIDLTQISDTPKMETGSVLPLWHVLVFFFF